MTTRPSAWHTLGRALGMVAALPARAVGLAIAHRPHVIPLLIDSAAYPGIAAAMADQWGRSIDHPDGTEEG